MKEVIEVQKLKINKFKFQAQMYKMKMLTARKRIPLEIQGNVFELSANSPKETKNSETSSIDSVESSLVIDK